ncbi:MAG: (2Fe-2S)-binding protein [Candidatus Hydrogenedentota bacterium]
MDKVKIEFKVNNKEVIIETYPWKTLLGVLRDELGLTGTKEGCGKGECGACTVILNGRAVNSCLVLAVNLEGCEVLTIEGISQKNKLHPIQESFVKKGAIQCGFCTPGMVMSAYALLQKNKNPSIEEIKEAIAGNLCRCTGYTKIIEAIKEAAK